MAKEGDVIDVQARIIPDGEAGEHTETTEQPAPPVIKEKDALARFDPIKLAVAELIQEVAETTYDINTTAGEEVARKLLRKCISTRTGAEKLRKDLTAPMLAVQKKWIAQVKEIELAVSPLEAPLEQAIKAKDDAREAEKQRKIAEEEARIKALRAKIGDIAKIPAAAVSMDVAALEQAVLDLQSIVINDETFAEFLDEAEVLRNETVTQLVAMLDTKRLAEQQQRQLDADRAALAERQRKEAEERVLRGRIDSIKGRAFETFGKGAAQIAVIQAEVIAAEPVALEFGDLYGEADAAWRTAVSMISGAYVAATEADSLRAEQQRIADEQAATQQRLQEEERQRAAAHVRAEAELAERQKKLDDEEAARIEAAAARAAEEAAKPRVVEAEATGSLGSFTPPAGYVGLVSGADDEDDKDPPLSMSMFATGADYQAAVAERNAEIDHIVDGMTSTTVVDNQPQSGQVTATMIKISELLACVSEKFAISEVVACEALLEPGLHDMLRIKLERLKAGEITV